uniref:Ankyrin and armadillo repeat containing n=1 Tax=Sinocyclocheilus grahami TaxID=75366 RepID=A0A672QUH1_SINGR
IRQMRNILAPNIIFLAPFDSSVPLDHGIVHRIVGIYGFNQFPVISLVPNYDQSSCQLPPAYYDTKVGQILINIDYTMKALWHGSYISRSIMAVDSDGVPQTKKDALTEFLNAGDMKSFNLEQPKKDNMDVNPTYEPNSTEEENLFSQYSENILIKLSAYLTSLRQHQNVFVFEASHSLSNVVRLTEDNIDLATYQRLQKRLSDHIILVRKHLEGNAEVYCISAMLIIIIIILLFYVLFYVLLLFMLLHLWLYITDAKLHWLHPFCFLKYGSSPLLLSATSGSLEALDVLLSSGANWREEDSKGNNTVHLAALNFHTDVLRHLIQLNLEGLPVWKISCRYDIADLKSDCIMFLPNNNRCTAGGIPVLVGLLCSDRLVVQCMATGVLCYSSENRKVCEDLVHHGAVLVGIKLCSGHQPELHSRCAVILAILVGHSEHHQNLIAQLVNVLVNAVRCIRTLCIKSPCNQTAVAHAGGVPHLDKFLSVNSEVLQEEACLALAELAWGHWKNQRLICEAGAICALVQALRERKIPVKVKAATVLESIASHNPAIQQCFLRQSSAKCFQLEVQEQGATALWALAGQTLKQQKLMAEQMGYLLILDLLLSSSDKMQYVGKARYKLVLLYTVPKEITQCLDRVSPGLSVKTFCQTDVLSKSFSDRTVRTFITVEACFCHGMKNYK